MQFRFQVWRALGAVAAVSTLTVVACSDDGSADDDGNANGMNSGGNGGGSGGGASADGGSVFEELGIDDPDPDEFYFDEVETPYEDEAGCKAFDSAFPDVHDCSCDNCFALQQQCDALEGCREIAECGIEIGCSDAFSCYLAPADPKCVPIIDKWGNTGVSAALSLRLGDCTTAAGCR